MRKHDSIEAINSLYQLDNINTVNRLYETAKDYMEKFSEDDNYKPFMGISRNQLTNELGDIQKGFGCYFSNLRIDMKHYATSIAFNPNTNKYEDSAFSENIYEYLVYLKKLFEEEILVINENPIVHGKDFPYASFWGSVRTNIDLYDYFCGPNYLMGSNNQNLYERKFNQMSFGFLRGTQNISDYIDVFFNDMVDNRNFQAAMYAGISEVDYKEYYESFYEYNLNGEYPGFWMPTELHLPFIPASDGISYELVYESVNEGLLSLVQYIEYYKSFDLSNGYILNYQTSEEFLEKELNDSKIGVVNFNDMVLFPILTGEKSIDDAVMEYRNLAKEKGTQEFLSQLNLKRD